MTDIDLSDLAAARDGIPLRTTSVGWLPTSPRHGITGLVYLVVDDADVLKGLAAGSWAIAAADVFEHRHANTQHR
jgi:hypothetical protein